LPTVDKVESTYDKVERVERLLLIQIHDESRDNDESVTMSRQNPKVKVDNKPCGM